MIHPTRTNLLLIREKALSVSSSIRILKARKQALTREFLETTRPFLRSREEIRELYGKALAGLALSMGHEGKGAIESITATTSRDFSVDITEMSIWGLKYKEVTSDDCPVRDPGERGYDYYPTTPHLQECTLQFEKILESMMALAVFEGKLKRLGDEILKATRRIRVLEERVLPGLTARIRAISQHIGEREREAYCRLKHFKDRRPSGLQERS
jgi:V/A-type H+-transporting ATPase subunit D